MNEALSLQTLRELVENVQGCFKRESKCRKPIAHVENILKKQDENQLLLNFQLIRRNSCSFLAKKLREIEYSRQFVHSKKYYAYCVKPKVEFTWNYIFETAYMSFLNTKCVGIFWFSTHFWFQVIKFLEILKLNLTFESNFFVFRGILLIVG